jgi:MFS family permease
VPVTLRSLIPSAFLPAVVYEIGNGAALPVIALTAVGLGASPATAAVLLGAAAVGQVVGDVPASSLAARVGDRRAMLIAAAAAAACMVACFLAPSLLLLGAALVLAGMCNSVFYLARQTYVMEVIPTGLRARAMSTLAGSHRVGLFVGPFVGAGAIALGGLRAAYLVGAVAMAVTFVLVWAVPDVPRPEEAGVDARRRVPVLTMLRAQRRMLATLGLGVVAVGAVRGARQTVLPLWAEHLGLSGEQTSLVFGIAAAVDMALFYPAGRLMDRYGRLSVAVPAMVVLGGTMIALPLTQSMVSLTVVAMVMSFGNGIGSGIVMTLGADVAPAEGRLRFLSIWRLVTDSGIAAGPLVVSVVAGAATLAAGVMTVGALGVLSAAMLGRWAPRYSPYAVLRRSSA